MGSRPRAPTRASAAPLGVASRPRRLPLRGRRDPDAFHRARPAVAAVGLGRWPPDEPERLPSVRLEPCGPSGLGHACCSRASPRPAPCRLLRARSASSKAGRSPRAIPRSRGPPRRCQHEDRVHGEKDASHRLLQPTSVTSTLRIARFPVCPVPRPVLRRFTTRSTGSPWA